MVPAERRWSSARVISALADVMAMKGVPIAEISRLLGHGDSRITERVYAKHTPDYLRRAIEALSG